MTTERLQELLTSDVRAFNLIWACESGKFLSWDSPAGGMSAKIDTTDGLASRIRVVTKILEQRNVSITL